MNTVESKTPSVFSLYSERLSNLSQTLSSLHSRICNDPSVLLLQTHPILQKYQTDRINELVKQIVDDQRQVILISCLEAYHQLQSQLTNSQILKKSRQQETLWNEEKQQQLQMLKTKDLQRIEMGYQLDEARDEIKRLKEELVEIQSTKGTVQRDLKISMDLQRSNLQNLVHSLTIENRKLRDQSDQVLEHAEKERRIEFTLDNSELKEQIRRLKVELEQKNQLLVDARRQIQDNQSDSNNRIQLSEKYSHLTQYKRSQFIRQAGNLLQLQPKAKFRVAEFQQLCFEMSKQQQQLKLIRINFRNFKDVLQTGVKSHLQVMRKMLIAMKSKMQEEVQDSQRQMMRFVQLFQGKATKIIANERLLQQQKVEMMKGEYEQIIHQLEQKSRVSLAEEKKMVSEAEIKIKDERIQQLEAEIYHTKHLEAQYKQLLVINDELKGKYNQLTIQNRQPTIQSPQRLVYPLSPNPPSYLEVTPRLQTHSNLLRSSKSLSPNRPLNTLPLSPSHYNSKLNIPYSKTNYSNQMRYNPQLYLQHPTSDSRTRKQLQTGFNQLQEEIQAIIQRRSKRNARGTFGY